MKRLNVLLGILLLTTGLGTTYAAPTTGKQMTAQREALVACYNPETKRLEPCF